MMNTFVYSTPSRSERLSQGEQLSFAKHIAQVEWQLRKYDQQMQGSKRDEQIEELTAGDWRCSQLGEAVLDNETETQPDKRDLTLVMVQRDLSLSDGTEGANLHILKRLV